MPYGIAKAEVSIDGPGFNINDVTTSKPLVHFAYARRRMPERPSGSPSA
jgi:hypothetical protein